MQVEIPGGIAELRDRLSMGGRRMVMAHAVEMWGATADLEKATAKPEGEEATGEEVRGHVTAQAYDLIERTNDALAIALLKSWTIPHPLPTIETLDDIEDPQTQVAFYAIRAKVWADFGKHIAMPDFSVDGAMKNGKPDPESPTSASAGSSGGDSEATTRTTSPTVKSSKSSTSTSSEPFSLAPLTSST